MQNLNKKRTKILLILLSCIVFISLSACDKDDDTKENVGETESVVQTSENTQAEPVIEVVREIDDVPENNDDDAVLEDEKETLDESQIVETGDTISDESESDSEASETSDEQTDTSDKEENKESDDKEDTESSKKLPRVIWLGDSLTQGSLGDDNGNVNNPQAPWRVVASKYGIDIIGYGYYGHNTHDLLWRYGEDGGKKNSENIYVFWAGSNDFVNSENGINDVLYEINRFVEAGNIDKYIVMGTTDREALGREKAVAINSMLKQAYGSKYLDILDYVEFGPDQTHLTVNSYSRIADVVYNKIMRSYGK